jgi:hypothetical protein
MKLSIRRLAVTLLLLGAISLPYGPARSEARAAGTFQGTYTCAQGLTAATLQIIEGPADQLLQATFYFGPTPENPSVPRGSFLMEGRLDRASGAILLAPTFWVQQPKGYNMIGLIGRIGEGFGAIEGNVLEGAECTTFRLQRVVG